MCRPLPLAYLVLALCISLVNPSTSLASDGPFNMAAFNKNYDLPAGKNAACLVIIDLNGDGKKELVSANYGDATLSIFKNSSTPHNIGFSPQQVLNVGSKASSIDAADLDGDGMPDLAVANEQSGISLYRNISSGAAISFAAGPSYSVNNYAVGIAIGDLDGDGKPDIAVVCNQSAKLAIFHNTSTPGEISFAAPVYFSTGTTPQSVTIGDLDNDGKPEVAVTNYFESSISIYHNGSSAGDIAFDGRTDLVTGTQPHHVAIGDLDGDGKPEVAVANAASSTISVFRNTSADGSLEFDPRLDLAVGTTPYNVAIGDLDKDGRPELVTSDYSIAPSLTSVLQNTSVPGTLSFASKMDYATGNSPYFTAVADLDGDGQKDIATANFGGASVSILLNEIGNSSPSKIPAITYVAPSWGRIGSTVYITGVNFDPVPANNIVYFGAAQAIVTAATPTQLKVTVPSGASYEPISVTVKNLTAYSQIAFYVTFPGIYASFGKVPFDSIPYNLPSNNPRRVIIRDLDGDGKTDILISDQGANTITAYRNKSLPQRVSFDPGKSFASGEEPFDIAMSDFDGDGRQDAAVTNFNHGNAATLSVFQNTSTNAAISFATPLSFPVGNGASSVAAGDLDGDGKPDLAVCSGNSYNVSILVNTTDANGQLSFENKLTLDVPSRPQAAVIVDLDGDGRSELIIANLVSNTITVYRNISTPGQPAFYPMPDLATGGAPTYITAADVNNDAKPDILVSNFNSSTISIFANTSTADGPSLADAMELETQRNPYSLSVADLDGDGKADIVVPADIPNSFGIFKNTSDAVNLSFAPRVDDYTGFGPTHIGIGDLDGDGKPDLAIANHYEQVGIRRNNTGEPTVIAAGTSPVQGPISSSFSLDSAVQTYKGSPYVQRHYDIEPVNNAANATATVTLYFQQQEFDSFNAVPNHGPDLPFDADDTAGIANIRIYQFHGTSSSRLPGSYSGGSVIIDPANSNISFDQGTQVWKVTFDVKGFSGFFAGNKGSNIVTGINDISVNANNALGLYPNPATSFVIAKHPATSSAQLQLVDISGRIVRTIQVTAGSTQTQIYMDGLSKGIYSLTWRSRNQQLSQTFQYSAR